MRIPPFLRKGDFIGFVAPAFGCNIEPYYTAFQSAAKKFSEKGFLLDIGPNCYKGEGIGISNLPEKCAEEINLYFAKEEVGALISCGGGELMCEILDDVDFVDREEFDRISIRCNPKRDDILISCSGSVGRSCVVKDDNKYVMVRSAAMVRCIDVDPEYVCTAICSDYVQRQIDYLIKETCQANLFQAAIASLIIPLPPLKEQKRIISRLNSILPLCYL